MLALDHVTLIGIDGVSFGRLALAFDISAHACRFGAQKILTPFPSSDPRAVLVPPLTHEQYSRFVIHELRRYVETSHALLVQYDGFVLNPDAWTDVFLDYDYVGAPWRPPMRGAIGGFSLRSKRFLEATSRIVPRRARGNEDILVCHSYGARLEEAGMRFAPPTVCRRFAFDATGAQGRRTAWNGEFGFHNLANTRLSRWRLPERIALDAGTLARTVLELGGITWRQQQELEHLRRKCQVRTGAAAPSEVREAVAKEERP